VRASGTLKIRDDLFRTGQGSTKCRFLVLSVKYLQIVWPALLFGVLIAAGVRAFVPCVARTSIGGGPRSSTNCGSNGWNTVNAVFLLCVSPFFCDLREIPAIVSFFSVDVSRPGDESRICCPLLYALPNPGSRGTSDYDLGGSVVCIAIAGSPGARDIAAQ
jgi:hypothetical protein